MLSVAGSDRVVDPSVEKGRKILAKLEDGPWRSYVRELK